MRDRIARERSRMLRNGPAIVAVLLFLAGCTASKKMMQIAKDPSTPVGELRDQPSLVALSMVAAKDMNPNVHQPVQGSVAGTKLPYSVSLSGDDLADLAEQLKVTLRQVQGELNTAGSPSDDIEAEPVSTNEATEGDDSRMQAEAGIDEVATDADAESDADENADAEGPQEAEERDDGVARQVGEYRDALDGDSDDEQQTSDERSSRNANPVEIAVYQLKDDGRFLSADFDLLHDDPKEALGKTYLDHDEFVMRPGQFKFARFFPVKEQAQFIAIVASYEDIDSIVWKAIARIEPTGGRYPLLVSLDKHGVSIQKEE